MALSESPADKMVHTGSSRTKDTAGVVIGGDNSPTETLEYFFPEHGITIHALTLEEAEGQLGAILNTKKTT